MSNYFAQLVADQLMAIERRLKGTHPKQDFDGFSTQETWKVCLYTFNSSVIMDDMRRTYRVRGPITPNHVLRKIALCCHLFPENEGYNIDLACVNWKEVADHFNDHFKES